MRLHPAAERRQPLGGLADNGGARPDEGEDLLECCGQHPAVVGQPQHAVTDTIGRHEHSLLHAEAVHQDIGVAIVVFVSLQEGGILVGLGAQFVTQVPDDVGNGPPPLHHIAATGKIIVDDGHVFPPGLPAQERGADTRPAERCPGRQERSLRVMRIGMVYEVRDALSQVGIGDLLEHTPLFVPRMGERGKGFGRNPRLAVETGSRGGRFYGLEIQRPDEAVGERLPEFAHRDIGIFVIFEDVGRENVAGGRFIRNSQALLPGERSHRPVEILGKKFRNRRTPVAQEPRRGLLVVDHEAHDGRKPAAQRIVVTPGELGFHIVRPGLGLAFPAVEQHAIEQPAGQRAVVQASDVAGELRPGPVGRQFIALPPGSFGRGR